MCVSLSVQCESRELVPDYICYSNPRLVLVDPPAREIKISADPPVYTPGDIPSDFSNTLQAPADSLVGTSIYPSIDTCINSPSRPAILLIAHSFVDSLLDTYKTQQTTYHPDIGSRIHEGGIEDFVGFNAFMRVLALV